MRESHEQYAQDYTGDVTREVDEILGLAGADERNGLHTTEAAGETEVVMEIPESANGVFVDKLQAFSSTAAELTVKEAELDDDGVIVGEWDRSVTFDLAGGETLDVDYSGGIFDSDAVAVETSEAGVEVSVGVYVDHREYDEPASTQFEAPGE